MGSMIYHRPFRRGPQLASHRRHPRPSVTITFIGQWVLHEQRRKWRSPVSVTLRTPVRRVIYVSNVTRCDGTVTTTQRCRYRTTDVVAYYSIVRTRRKPGVRLSPSRRQKRSSPDGFPIWFHAEKIIYRPIAVGALLEDCNANNRDSVQTHSNAAQKTTKMLMQ